jgi:hypothetical protein
MTEPFAWFRYQQGSRVYYDTKKWDDCQPLYTQSASDYERGFIDGMQKQMQSSVDKAVNRMAQPEQEPVGDEWTPCMKLPVVVYVRKQRLGESHVSTREGITPVKPDDLIMRGVSGEEYPIGRAIFERTYSLNTTPPQRTWVGLTDEDRSQLVTLHHGWNEYAQAIEAKLKEKNT